MAKDYDPDVGHVYQIGIFGTNSRPATELEAQKCCEKLGFRYEDYEDLKNGQFFAAVTDEVNDQLLGDKGFYEATVTLDNDRFEINIEMP